MKASLEPDKRWLAMILEGGRKESDALIEIYDNLKPMVFDYVFKNSGAKEDAEDVLQDALIAFSENVHTQKYRAEASVKNYILRIVRNIWLNQLKRQSRFSPLNLDALGKDELVELPVELELLRNTQTRKLLKAMSQLHEGCLSIFKMYYWYNWPLKKIADLLEMVSVDSLKSKKHRCAKALHKYFEAHPGLADELRNGGAWR